MHIFYLLWTNLSLSWPSSSLKWWTGCLCWPPRLSTSLWHHLIWPPSLSRHLVWLHFFHECESLWRLVWLSFQEYVFVQVQVIQRLVSPSLTESLSMFFHLPLWLACWFRLSFCFLTLLVSFLLFWTLKIKNTLIAKMGPNVPKEFYLFLSLNFLLFLLATSHEHYRKQEQRDCWKRASSNVD
ncbi:unnamed protein product [Meloidogyne enterolobii]|uniref:Uncharacterized protein n=1 Tax=Meloidogyne enterolobii TaxID=390850 RepID=A0ACB1A882_MELEN